MADTFQVPKSITADLIACSTRDEWAAERAKSLGASEAASILGASPHGSRVAVWADKIQPPTFAASEEWQEIKLLVEGPALAFYQRKFGGEVRHWPQTWLLRSRDLPLHCTPDGLALDPDEDGWGLVQVKAWSEFDAAAWTDEPPLYVQVQVQTELAVTGLQWAYVAVLFGTQRLARFRVARNERFIAALVRAAREFWAMVESQTEPPLDGSEATTRALARLHPNDDGSAVLLPPDADRLLERRERLASLAKRVDDVKSGIDNQLRAWIGDATYGITSGERAVSWKSQTRKSYTVAESTYRTLRACKVPKLLTWREPDAPAVLPAALPQLSAPAEVLQ